MNGDYRTQQNIPFTKVAHPLLDQQMSDGEREGRLMAVLQEPVRSRAGR